MKKIGLICATALMGMTLSACGSSSSQKSTTSSNSSSKATKVVRHHKKANSEKKQSQSSTSSQQSTSQSSNNGLPPASNLHDFVNRYGESPAAYLAEHNGMSPEQAVQSVPDTMKTSGEIQDTYQIQQGQDPFN
ncbi:hypothetical protein GIX82_08700 [Lactobacillus reuteri]|nr:hypothetical protein [Limosilactobacillus reuteri]